MEPLESPADNMYTSQSNRFFTLVSPQIFYKVKIKTEQQYLPLGVAMIKLDNAYSALKTIPST